MEPNPTRPEGVKFQHNSLPIKRADTLPRKKKTTESTSKRSHNFQEAFTESGDLTSNLELPPSYSNKQPVTKKKSVERAKSIEKAKSQEMDKGMRSPKPEPDRIVRINVGGTIFETWASTLAKYPKTLLGAMFSGRNEELIDKTNDTFFDRDPRVFEVILNYYRTGKIIKPSWIPLELLTEELLFWSMDIPQDHNHHRISVELLKLEYRHQIYDAKEYRKIARHKLLSEHHAMLVKILKMFSNQVEKHAVLGHNSCDIVFYSPLHYNDATPRELFDVISKDEIRELIVELLEEKQFLITDLSQEYSKTKATDIIGLDDQVTNYNDPKFFSFEIRW